MRETFNRRLHQFLLLAAVVVLGVGTVVYHFVEHLGWVDAYYFSVVALATVGFGDITPHTTFGKIFTTFYIFFGVAIIAAFARSVLIKRSSKIRKHIKRRK